MPIQREPPWPGPKPYDETDWHRFHGREREIDETVARLETNKLLVNSARSGAGKTSFLRAGVVPTLRRERGSAGGRAVLLVRDWARQDEATADAVLLDAMG